MKTKGQRNRNLNDEVRNVVRSTRVYDIHTHLYDPAFGSLLLWGIDDLLVYHYLVAEVFRTVDIPYASFWKRSKSEQADLIWEQLFLRHSPISEACRGVVTTLNSFGLDVGKRDLGALRKWFAAWTPENFIGKCMELGGVEKICMTNSPFDPLEAPVWQKGVSRDSRFDAALRIDPLLLSWKKTAVQLRGWNYKVNPKLDKKSYAEIRRFLSDWTQRINPKYLMVSLDPAFAFPADTDCARIIENAVLPHCAELTLPFAMMMGVKRGVNPQLELAGDGMAKVDLSSLESLCANYSSNKFLVTVLSRENQHELCVIARKFRNLHVFGCWWFMNVPCIIDEMTRMRLELLGLGVTPQHSDARVLDQLVYKWRHSREIIADVLVEKYVALQASGWQATPEEIQRDVKNLFGGSFQTFCKARLG